MLKSREGLHFSRRPNSDCLSFFFSVLPKQKSGTARVVEYSSCMKTRSAVAAVRNDLRDWILSHEGDKWTVRLDVKDLGGAP